MVFMFDYRCFEGGDAAIQAVGGFKYLCDAVIYRQYRYRKLKSWLKGKKYTPKCIMLVANKADMWWDDSANVLWQQQRLGEHKVFDPFREDLIREGNMLNWNMGGRGRVPQEDMNLANMSDSHLMALGQQGNASHAQLLEMQNAQQGMLNVAQRNNIEVPQVNFYPSRHVDPRKSRKSDIKQARRLLKPSKRSIFMGELLAKPCFWRASSLHSKRTRHRWTTNEGYLLS